MDSRSHQGLGSGDSEMRFAQWVTNRAKLIILFSLNIVMVKLHCFFSGGKITLLTVYVDEIIITRSFEVKDLGNLHYFLGIKVAYNAQGIYLSQRKYVLDLLAETGMLDCRPASTTIEQNHHTIVESGGSVDKYKYQRLVGRLIYLSNTRPDIAYSISVVSQYIHDPRTSHLDVVNRILRYLKSCWDSVL
jgi:hypothetical protein